MGSENEETQTEETTENGLSVHVDDMSAGLVCPFMTQTQPGDFGTDAAQECIGERCAMYQSYDFPVPEQGEDGQPVIEEVQDEDGNTVGKRMKVGHIHRLCGCGFTIMPNLMRESLETSSRIERMTTMLTQHLGRVALASRQQQQGPGPGDLVVPGVGYGRF